MKINRLFEIVYILLDKKTVTAKELSERLDVSIRTIYRDIDTLSSSNIPIYTSKGSGGGISILPNYVLNKSILTDEEQKNILAGLQSLRAAGYPDVDGMIDKMGNFFSKEQFNWIHIDFSSWGARMEMDHYFNILKFAILYNRLVKFIYHDTGGKQTSRVVEPIRLISKNSCWYLQGFCLERTDVRLFKLSRILDLKLLEETFQKRDGLDLDLSIEWGEAKPEMAVKLKFKKEMAFRVYDEFNIRNITLDEEGNLYYTGSMADDFSSYTFLLSYGDGVEIIKPDQMRQQMKVIAEKIYLQYS